MHRESDVDVAVLLDRSVYPSRVDRSELRVRLSADLAASTGIDAIDLVVLNDLPPTFARSIVLDGTRLLRADPALDHRFIRDIQLRAADLEPFLRRALALKLQRLGA
jgi:predicted nucleotidyltransferase